TLISLPFTSLFRSEQIERIRHRIDLLPRRRRVLLRRRIVGLVMSEEIAAEAPVVRGPADRDGGNERGGLVELGVQVVGVMEHERLGRARLARTRPLVAALMTRD